MTTSVQPPLTIVPEATPNPSSVRFALNRTLLSGPGQDFPSAEAAKASPLARELFLLPAVSVVYVGPNFVTVSFARGANDWALRPLVIQTIETFVASGQPAISTGAAPESQPLPQKAMTPTELGIMRILENEIQPAVAMDGGYISLAGYEKGVVKLHLRGSCHGCPSSLFTLKAGIENRLKQEFPEIVAVEAV